jgi:hypothetical protein
MKYGKRATIVGDTTGGGAHPTGPCTLGQGFVLNIPDARSWHEVTKTNWEGTGVYPDIYVNSELALNKAKAIIYKDLLSKADDPNDKNLYQWFVYSEENKQSLSKQIASDSVKYSSEQLQQFCGEYANRVPGQNAINIYSKGTALYIKFNLPGTSDLRLIPIGNNRFAYYEEIGRALEFTVDKNGKTIGYTNIRANGVNTFDKVK